MRTGNAPHPLAAAAQFLAQMSGALYS
jgi:hypothetical protein